MGAETYTGAEASRASYKAIFHIDGDAGSAMKKTVGNINNLLNDPRLKGKIKIELLANSKGYKIYDKNNGLEKQLLDLQSRGVILAQCNNTLNELKVDRATLYPFISIVPSGVGELTIRQADGWAYIHPSP